MSGRGGDLECKVYVGDLPNDTSEKELEKEFEYYGRQVFSHVFLHLV